MIRGCTRFLICVVAICACSRAPSGLRTPNRGKQLFMLIQERGGAKQVVAMDEPSRWVIQQWNRYTGTYDFISAVATVTDTGCKLDFTRYVMKEDYMPSEEHRALAFPYAEQPRYRLFDYGYITGFYRNSVHDIDYREFLPRQ